MGWPVFLGCKVHGVWGALFWGSVNLEWAFPELAFGGWVAHLVPVCCPLRRLPRILKRSCTGLSAS